MYIKLLCCFRFMFLFIFYLFYLFEDFYLFIFRERKGGRKKGREASICGCVLHVPPWGPGPPATKACALVGNQTGDPLVCRQAVSPLIRTSQG